MDRFIKIAEQKKDVKVDTIHLEACEKLKKCVDENKNVIVCGPSGVGKTHLVEQVVKDPIRIEKKTPLTYIEEMQSTILIEDYDAEPLLYKNIVDHVIDHGSPTGRPVVITSVSVYFLPNFETIILKSATIDQLLSIEDREGSVNAAKRSGGSIRSYLHYLNKYDSIDNFVTSKEYITSILCDTEPFSWNETVSEHGHVWDAMHENYIDSKGVDVVRAIQSISWADVMDGVIYDGHWELLPYFIHIGIHSPKASLGKPLKPEKVRSGSAWTKFGNYKMRLKKYNDIRTKTSRNLNIEELCLLKKYAEFGRYEKLLEYGLTPQDFDVMNHLAIATKLKQRDVTNIKKGLKNATEARR
jgi:hypothetical protein